MSNIDPRSQIYIDRLSAEWQLHGKIIICVDFDSTLSPYGSLANADDIKRTINLLKQCQAVGCYTVIHTACNEDRYQSIQDYCTALHLKVDTINKTPIEMEYGKAGSKPYANHFLDDRAALPASLDILEEAMVAARVSKYSPSEQTVEF